MEELNHDNQHSVVYGRKTIDFSLLYCDRKTMEIAVLPDSTVIVKAPVQSDIALIEKKIIKRARWILRQLNYFKQFNPKTPDRCYVNGETHLYLGKQYRLKLEEHELCHLKYHDHSPEFYRLLDSVIPGWEKIKHKLELSMV